MRCGGFGDNAAHVGTTREEDLVPALSQQCLCLGDTSLDDGVARRVESGLDDFLDDDSALGGVFAGLDDDRVSTGDGANDWAEGQLEGVVEGSACIPVSQVPSFLPQR